jgi:Zn-dependent M28 family amino/carboxypeptidase
MPAQYVDPAASEKALPSITVANRELSDLYESLAPDGAPLRVSARVEQPESGKLEGRNVAALLPGSDLALKDSCVVVSAHYDHIGERATGDDRIYNGANDNASGVAGLIEIARAFARLEQAPRRSILFIAYFGEEKGLIGARYYAGHPLFPLHRTVANINLEHLGRTDDNQGSQAGKATVTGYRFSDVGPILTKAGEVTGYEIYDRPGNDVYFDRSDNAPLAAAGVPAHTIAVTFEFPDYHDVGDEWTKLDYANMETVVETVALGIMTIADSPHPPQWNEENPRTARFRAARAHTR